MRPRGIRIGSKHPKRGQVAETRLPIRVPPEHRVENFQQLLSICRNNGVRLVIIHPAYANTVRHECELTTFCKAHDVRMFEAFDFLRGDSAGDPSESFLDGIHPNERRHELLASGLARFLIESGVAANSDSTVEK